ncbi:unnamed protein product [Discosporangium mesarthrocarpum]
MGQEWCIATAICTDERDAITLLNRMLRRGLLHHCHLSRVVENRSRVFYRFPQDYFKVLVDNTAGSCRRKRSSGKGGKGMAILEDRWYADVPSMPDEELRRKGKVLNKLDLAMVQRGLKRYPRVFTGKAGTRLLVNSGMAKDDSEALSLGNAFLKAGLFQHVSLRYPLRNDDSLYRLARDQYNIIMAQLGSREKNGAANRLRQKKKNRRLVMTFSLDGATVEEESVNQKKTKAAVFFFVLREYWMSYRASKLYVLNLLVVEGFIGMSYDWDNHVDQMFPTYCVCYLRRDKDATVHRTEHSKKNLKPGPYP